jgi:ABC-type transporter Mla maintaining outer membrane lipid asymmetry permease subunit MlaE
LAVGLDDVDASINPVCRAMISPTQLHFLSSVFWTYFISKAIRSVPSKISSLFSGAVISLVIAHHHDYEGLNAGGLEEAVNRRKPGPVRIL